MNSFTVSTLADAILLVFRIKQPTPFQRKKAEDTARELINTFGLPR